MLIKSILLKSFQIPIVRAKKEQKITQIKYNININYEKNGYIINK